MGPPSLEQQQEQQDQDQDHQQQHRSSLRCSSTCPGSAFCVLYGCNVSPLNVTPGSPSRAHLIVSTTSCSDGARRRVWGCTAGASRDDDPAAVRDGAVLAASVAVTRLDGNASEAGEGVMAGRR